MPNEFKAFGVSVAVLLLLIWIFNESFEIADSPISIVVLLVMFGLTYVWVKNEFFQDEPKDKQ